MAPGILFFHAYYELPKQRARSQLANTHRGYFLNYLLLVCFSHCCTGAGFHVRTLKRIKGTKESSDDIFALRAVI